MTKDDVIRLAREAGIQREVLMLGRNLELLTDFSKLVAEHEREACANVAREWVNAYPHPSGIIANNIMARGQA